MCGFHDFFRLEEQPLASPLYHLWNMFYQNVSLSAKVDIKIHVGVKGTLFKCIDLFFVFVMSLFPKARMDNFVECYEALEGCPFWESLATLLTSNFMRFEMKFQGI